MDDPSTDIAAASEPTPSDEQLLARAGEGDGEALGVLYERHGAILFALAMRLLAHREDAADLVHDIFLEAWEKARRYDATRASVRTWLVLRLRSRAIDRMRSAASNRAALRQQSAPTVVDDTTFAATDAIGRLLAQLSEPQRTVLTLSYFRGLSCDEIARQTDTPLGTVKSRLAAATLKMGELLQRRAGATH